MGSFPARNHTCSSWSAKWTCRNKTPPSSGGCLLTLCKIRAITIWMRHRHEGGAIIFSLGFGPTSASMRGKNGVLLLLWVMSMVRPTFFCSNYCKFGTFNKKVLRDVEWMKWWRLLPKFVVCINAKRLELKDVPCRRHLFENFCVSTCSTLSYATICSPVAHTEIEDAARSLVVVVHFSVLGSARLSTHPNFRPWFFGQDLPFALFARK